jgi:predicted membrane protein
MNDFESRREERRKWREERWRNREQYFNNGHGRIWTGLFIMLVGVAAFLKAYLTDLPNWMFSWPMLMIVIGFFIGVRHKFVGAAWFILMVLGSIFLIDQIDPDFSLRRYIWPIALIVVGFFLAIRPRNRNWRHHYWSEKKNTGMKETAQVLNEGTWSDDDFVDSTSIFGGVKKNILSKNFKGGDLVNVFGGTDLDLTQADFSGTAVIEFTTIFGGAKLIVPSNWSVKSEAVIIFGSVEDKRKMQTVTESPDKVLLLKGTVIFGGIDIKSY